MDRTYAEIENAYSQITTLSPMTATPKKPNHQNQMRQSQSRKTRHLREEFDSRLPIEYRYPKRNSVTSSSTTRKGSLVSKSSSSGYSSSGSISSITTVVSGVKPYRPKKEEDLFEKEEKVEVIELENEQVENKEEDPVFELPKKVRACCIECREKEIREELDLESHQYANIQSIKKPQDPYVFLMTTMLSNLQKDDGGRKMAKVQQKIEKVLRFKPREPFNVDNKLIFDRQICAFSSDVTVRLQAINDMAPEAYRDISARFCEALHHGTPNSKSLKSIVKGVKNLLNF
ncbi:Protein CBG17737 [Caenorhabditis briggsae]|uniref:Uncharacterized protein n=2 Tax=Caenorhabditis briggsae TaxID=6238 RepID=A0AAE9AAM7_CAEBR|nr:Protein CBG17737 [Caenorhabditis briggsae]ULT96709.1 hypothetical protein L3Y34_004923 [Caenorhabditis briggsae]UMM29891.1 hypothetical protein L5515_012020 [Caenorhabditis briggsae]CAP35221.1 Protein CBG17737 [Caenorhabditis briggsae]